MNLILLLLLCSLCVSYILSALQLTSFLQKFLKLIWLILGDIFECCFRSSRFSGPAPEDMEELWQRLELSSPFFYALLRCPFCLGFWVSLVVCGYATIYFSFDWVLFPMIVLAVAFLGSWFRILAERK